MNPLIIDGLKLALTLWSAVFFDKKDFNMLTLYIIISTIYHLLRVFQKVLAYAEIKQVNKEIKQKNIDI